MNREEALKAMLEGKKIRATDWMKGCYMRYDASEGAFYNHNQACNEINRITNVLFEVYGSWRFDFRDGGFTKFRENTKFEEYIPAPETREELMNYFNTVDCTGHDIACCDCPCGRGSHWDVCVAARRTVLDCLSTSELKRMYEEMEKLIEEDDE